MKAKLVSKSLNFERKSDPLDSLGVGKKVLITKWLDEMGVKNYIINDDYTIDVEYSVHLYNKNLEKFPEYIQFNKVYIYFSVRNNHLISLKGCPKIVGGDFYCDNNNLTSLEGCPIEVGYSFHCQNNKEQFTEKYVRNLCKVKGNIIYY
jgi:hypothetical protein